MSRERELLVKCFAILKNAHVMTLPVTTDNYHKLMNEVAAILAQPEAEPHPDRCPECLSPTGLLCSGEYCTGTWHRKKPAPQQESPNQTMTETTAPTAASGPTPETDARDATVQPWTPPGYDPRMKVVEFYHYERVKRQRDAARAENERLRKELDEARK